MEPYRSKHVDPSAPHPKADDLFDSFPIQKVRLADIKKWLALGWQDLRKKPSASLFYGVVFALLGIALNFIASANPVLVVAATTGFLLVGPFLAVGLYDLSRRIEKNEPPTLKHSMMAINRNAFGLGIYALALGLLSATWVQSSLLVTGMILTNPTIFSEGPVGLFTSLMAMEGGWKFIVGFFGIGLMFAIAAFATGVVTVPMLLHRKVNFVTAGMTSLRAVVGNPFVMAVWALTISVVIGLGLVTFYLGLIVAMPLIAHASWHAYRDLVDQTIDKPE